MEIEKLQRWLNQKQQKTLNQVFNNYLDNKITIDKLKRILENDHQVIMFLKKLKNYLNLQLMQNQPSK